MAFLVRKINKAKWPKKDFQDFDIIDLRADAITSCLRTSKDTLSTWEVETKEEASEAVLALASAFDKLSVVDIVLIDKEELLSRGFEIEHNAGDTKVPDLVDSHKDIAGLTYKTIGDFSQLMLDSMNQSGIERYNITKLRKLLLEAIEKGRLNKSDLTDRVQEEIGA